MKTTGKWVLVISLLAIVLLGISPVMGYTQLGETTTVTGQTSTVYAYTTFVLNSSSNWSEVTHISWDSNDIHGSGSFDNWYIVNDITHIGHASGSFTDHHWEADLIWHSNPPGNANRIVSNISNNFELWGGNFSAKGENYNYAYETVPFGFSISAPGPGPMGYNGEYKAYGGIPIPTASFSCAPTVQGLSLSVVCTDSSTDATSWYWTIDDETRDIHPLQTSTTRHYTWQSAYAGLYSVNLRATNGAESDWENKTNYVNITSAPLPTPTPTPGPTVAPGYVRSTFVTIDATTLYTIHGSNIMLYDTYAGTWTNSTSDADGSFYIDTLPYTIVNAYATFTIFANEFAPAELLGVNVGNAGIDNAIRMYPVSSPPPAGYVNLFVTTMDNNGNVVRDASINALWNSIQHSSSSGTYGTAQYVVPNNTQVRLSASKTGYSGTTETINVGEGPSYAWTLYLAAQTVTSTPTTTYTTGPGGTVPTTVGPYGTPGPSGTMASGYTNTQGQRMLDFLATNGMGLVELCFMVTILALLGVKLGK
jgi:PKD repeat protein